VDRGHDGWKKTRLLAVPFDFCLAWLGKKAYVEGESRGACERGPGGAEKLRGRMPCWASQACSPDSFIFRSVWASLSFYLSWDSLVSPTDFFLDFIERSLYTCGGIVIFN
jgi:hypothetical protein